MKLIRVKKKDAGYMTDKEYEILHFISEKEKNIRDKYDGIDLHVRAFPFGDTTKFKPTINWASIGPTSISETKKFANNLLKACSDMEKFSKEIESKYKLKYDK